MSPIDVDRCPPAPVVAAAAAVGVTGAEGDEAGLVPALLVAVTVNVYAVPFVKPVTVADNPPAVYAVAPPGDAVTV